MAAAGALLAACAPQQAAGPSSRVYAVDQAGGAKSCNSPTPSLTAGQATDVALKVGNDGGWCAITVSQSGHTPFSAGLLTAPPAHGKVLIHTVGDDTRIDYTPTRGFTGSDAFTVKLIPGDPVVRAAVTVTP
jgi:hypothetical protein